MSFVAGTDWLAAQVRAFAAALMGGALLGCCWRLYSALCRPGRASRRAWLLPDLIFSVAASALLAAYWFACTDGGLRPRDILFLTGGFLLFLRLPPLPLPRPRRRTGRHGQGRGSTRRQRKKAAEERPAAAPDRLLQASARGLIRLRQGARKAGKGLADRLRRCGKREAEADAETGREQEK